VQLARTSYKPLKKYGFILQSGDSRAVGGSRRGRFWWAPANRVRRHCVAARNTAIPEAMTAALP